MSRTIALLLLAAGTLAAYPSDAAARKSTKASRAAAPATAPVRRPPPPAHVTPTLAQQLAVQQLHALFDATWERDLRDQPLAATYYGDPRYNDRWPDLSPAGRQRVDEADRDTLDTVKHMSRDALPASEQLNYDLFLREMTQRVEGQRFHPEAYGISAGSGPQTLNELAETMPLNTVADHEAWIKRMESLPVYLEQVSALMRDEAKAGRTQPRMLMERVLPQLQMQLADTPETSPFYAAFAKLPAKAQDTPGGITAAEVARLQARAKQVIVERVVPAYRRFDAFFRNEYLPACRESVGISDTPDGVAYYAFLAHQHTTTNLTPEQIHQIGLQEVTRIHGEMKKVMAEVGFQGDEAAFFQKLRTDPQFYYRTPDELFHAYVYTAKMIEPELPKLFGKLYRTPFGVRPIPDTSAPNTTTAYYSPLSMDGKRAGYYYVNLYKPEVRPKWEIEVLTSHESVPGHHLQIALAQELDLPQFRRAAGYTAFVEGWALYSERLGYELGLYKDPYSRFGQLTYDMWRAVRLVVDTGIHTQHWTRQQAIDYFKANTPKTETDIVNEVDRYIGWPGQALAYKIGQLKILELRAWAQAQLGERFDIRAFHDTLLGQGAVPLDVLERIVHDWVAAQKNAPPAAR